MRKVLIFLIPFIFATLVFFGFMFFLSKSYAKGALQVTSKPKSNVYLNGKIIGQTPLCKCEGKDMLNEGEYTVRLIPLDNPSKNFEEKIKISKSTLTVVDRTFGNEASSEGSVITLTPLENAKSLELLIISFPDNVEVLVDGNASGSTPLLLKNLTESDHEVRLLKNGYKEKTIRIRTVVGYKLTVVSYLGVDLEAINSSPSADAKNQATSSAIPSLTQVIILNTPTGFLRVREDSTLNSLEIARVYPNEKFDLVEEKDAWYKIKLKDGKEGWISSQYAKKQ